MLSSFNTFSLVTSQLLTSSLQPGKNGIQPACAHMPKFETLTLNITSFKPLT